MSDIVKKAFENIEPNIDRDLNIANTMAFINLLTELGYRPDKPWSEEESGILDKLSELANEHTLRIKEIWNQQ
jgi:hypothetical protein